MRFQMPNPISEAKGPFRLSGRLLDLDFHPAQSRKLDEVFHFAKTHRHLLAIATLSFLLIWQWHVAGLATLRAEKAERDMNLNAQQAIQLSNAVLNAQASRDRLERSISGVILPPGK